VGFVDPHPEVIAVGCERVYFVVGFYFLDGLVELFSGALRGYGCSLPPAVISLVAICGVRIVWVYTAFVAWPAFRVIMYAYPLSWAPTVVLLMLMYRLYRKNLKVVHMLG
jgi:Na+-driven multidrug efflux pump